MKNPMHELSSKPVPIAVPVRESLVPFKARILMAVPGKSLNGRIYPKETLQQTAPLYVGKPFILDHNIEDSNGVVGVFTSSEYATERSAYTGETYEGLWNNVVGMMSPDLFQKIKGNKQVPPLIRNVSIGGQGDGEFGDNGMVIKNFVPAEGSLTAFPGIPSAHISAFEQIRESYTKSRSMKTEVSLEEAEQQASAWKKKAKEMRGMTIREGPIMPSIPPNRPALRGANTVPDSIPRISVNWTRPQPTTSSDSGVKIDPQIQRSSSAPFQSVGANTYAGLKGQSSTEQAPGTAQAPGSKDAKAWSPKVPKVGRTTTQTPGFGKMSPSGTGMTDQSEAKGEEEEEEEETARRVQNLQADMNNLLTIMRTGREAQPVDVSKPEEEEEEEEESQKEEALLMQMLVKRQLAREGNVNLGDQKGPWSQIGYGSMNTDYSRSLFKGPRIGATHRPPNEAGPQDNADLYKAGSKAPAFAPQEAKGEEEEEEEERLMWNRLLQLRAQREAKPGQEPRANAPIPKSPKLGATTTKTPGFGKLSPSGTGLPDQSEEEEETIMYNGHVYRREASDVDVTKDSPEKEEEESMPRMPSDLLTPQSPEPNLMKIQRDPDMDGDKDFVAANPVRSGGEEEEHDRQLMKAVESARGFSAPDTVPIEGHAPSMPLGAGISKLLDYLKPRDKSPEASAKTMIESWRQAKQPAYQPLQKIRVRSDMGQEPVKEQVQVQPLRGVPAKGMMSIAPTIPYQSKSQGFRDLSKVAESAMDVVKKRPFAKYNLGHQMWLEVLPQLIEVER